MKIEYVYVGCDCWVWRGNILRPIGILVKASFAPDYMRQGDDGIERVCVRFVMPCVAVFDTQFLTTRPVIHGAN